MGTRTITVEEALSGYGNKTVWLVVSAFLIAGGVIRTGFGRRLALVLVSRLAKSPLGLGYSICGAELLLGPRLVAVKHSTRRRYFSTHRALTG